MPIERFPFLVQKDGDDALVVMDCGDGIMRARHMPQDLLAHLGRMCQALREQAEPLLSEHEIPPFPGCVCLIRGRIAGVCEAAFCAHRSEAGAIERVIGIYDDGDRDAPVLVLIEEQIDDFIGQAS